MPTGNEEIPALVPDMSVSPLAADVVVGGRFQGFLDIVDVHPRNCNQGYGSGKVRSSDPSVVAFEGTGGYHRWRVLVAVAPGTASPEAADLRTPSGGRAEVPLTVCADPAGASEGVGVRCRVSHMPDKGSFR